MKIVHIFLPILSAVSFAQNHADAYDETSIIVNDTVKKVKVIEPIQIQTTVQGKTVALGKTGVKAIDLPQGLQVIDDKIIEQQQAIRLSDVIKNANGVYVSSARGGAQESFFSRGYDMSANNIFKNGFRVNSGSMPEVASLDQVEYLKGGSALLFGNVAPGGILNLVTKTPQFKYGGSLSMQAGSFNYFKPVLDFYGPLNKSIAYRLVTSYENSESFRDVVKRERFYINPSILFKVSKRTNILVQGDYLNDNWTPDFGTGAIGKNVFLDIPRSTYLGARWSNGLTNQSTITAQINHKFNENWKLNANSSFQDFRRFSEGTERIVINADGSFTRPLGKNNNLETILGQQFNVQGVFTTWGMKHQLAMGVDLDKSFTEAYTYVFGTGATSVAYDTASIYDPSTYENDHAYAAARNTRIVKTEATRFGVYFQDLISLTSKFKVLAGLRWSWQESQATTYAEVTGQGNPYEGTSTVGKMLINKEFTPKIGLVYQPFQNTSLFASYSSSFSPNTATDVYGNVLEASIIDQYEVGVKKGFFDNKLTTNVTVYQIINSNLAQTALYDANGNLNNNAAFKVLSGETTSKGFEIDVTAQPIKGLNVNAGYSYNDMRFTDVEAKPGNFIEGDRVARTPYGTANLSFFYTVQNGILKGFSIGAIGNHVGDRIGGWNNDYQLVSGNLVIRDREIPVRSYTTFDTSVGYEWKKFSILCKLSNITNELNFTVHENYSINPIAPRQFMATLKYKF
ncbi:Probable TonB-dependent outer membrane ferrichrome-iron receptor precursor FhuA [Flavobacterium indicum GPTSA100-9 = DSM 17447]|uniref:Probable TonB-dependent outer membrane ferrichrome-iron receptor FhuA n=1 Tax=Flavobacterium indicum (strain DSM 17447 / CIP 109464 / GPTSA100-9) TaxID=1094466 RepID=H8XUV9_FLAIG|nr:TonB-dependent siderophore receptor [Flavobacterium indicum]CCG53887.1 Probable TonB-dependent outer membrane ferrichrome-iron receptor precursor FhuA [Flavobacterium indicum GPTSA100-9 = DSM 17447]